MKNELTKYAADPIAAQLIKAGTFEPAKYEQVSARDWPREISRINPGSIAEAIKAETPTVATYRKYKGDGGIKIMLSVMIKRMGDAFNVGKKMTDTQILLTVSAIAKNYYFLSIADIKHCFDRAIMGEYGPLFDRLDTNTILEWLRKYQDERLGVAAFLAEQEHNNRKNERVNPADVDKEGMAKIGELGKKLKAKKKPKEETPVPQLEKELNYKIAIEQSCREAWEAQAAKYANGEPCELYNEFGEYKLYYQHAKNAIFQDMEGGAEFAAALLKYFNQKN